MRRIHGRHAVLGAALVLGGGAVLAALVGASPPAAGEERVVVPIDRTGARLAVLDRELARALADASFTGSIESTLETRLGRPIDSELAELGRLLFFDRILSLHDDNACAGCHSPANGFGDTQSIAIGIRATGS